MLPMGISVYSYIPLVVFAIFIARRGLKRARAPLPPGPKPLPIVGNLHQFPQQRPWLTFKEWKDTYGDIVYVNVLGQPTVILNTRKAATDILDKRSAIYSDRPRLAMLVELMGFDWDMPFMSYSNRWRQYRRLFQQFFNERAVVNYRDTQERSTHNLLRRLLRNPENFLQHIRLSFSETALHAMYDISVDSYDNSYVQLIEKSLALANEATIPGRFLVDLLPILKYVPSWFPGAGFKQHAKLTKEYGDASKDIPAEYTLNRSSVNGPPKPTIFTQILDMCEQEHFDQKLGENSRDIAKNVAAIAYTAGSDTTVSAIQGFFLAITNHPEVQRAAQKELDNVIGTDRLPTFNDIQDLPYIWAVIKEVLRWNMVVPVGVAHRLIEDDVYEGYFIPKGAMVMANIWAMLRDPEVYPEPLSFNPSRWLIETPEGPKLNDTIPDPYIAFGHGRRICPGRHFALGGLFTTVANVLACFNISPLDDLGNPCERLSEAYTDGFLIFPKPFKVSIVPRSEKALKLIEELDI